MLVNLWVDVEHLGVLYQSLVVWLDVEMLDVLRLCVCVCMSLDVW